MPESSKIWQDRIDEPCTVNAFPDLEARFLSDGDYPAPARVVRVTPASFREHCGSEKTVS
jgi:hypothetical protein